MTYGLVIINDAMMVTMSFIQVNGNSLLGINYLEPACPWPLNHLTVACLVEGADFEEQLLDKFWAAVSKTVNAVSATLKHAGSDDVKYSPSRS